MSASVDPALLALGQPIKGEQPWPRPSCPNCSSGHIGFDKPEDVESDRSERGHPGFDPEWIHGTFTVTGQCENPACGQTVHGTGDYRVAWVGESGTDEMYVHEGVPYARFYRLAHLHPPMLLMPIPLNAPEEIRDGILRASRVLFVDPGLAGTALRSTVERFLTSQGISRKTDKGGFRGAGVRLAEWRKADSGRTDIAELFSAILALGNEGTHDDGYLTLAEVLLGAGLLDEALHRVYIGPDMERQAQTIVAAGGPNRPGQGSGHVVTVNLAAQDPE